MTTLAWLAAGADTVPDTSAYELCLLADGVLKFTHRNKEHANLVILSAGIHGNETAPIEMLASLCDRMLAGDIDLWGEVLVIFGNLPAIAQNRRYVSYDLNRLFFGDDKNMPDAGEEYERACLLKQILSTQIATKEVCYHLDLHTSIRPSLFEQFALLPVNSVADDTLFCTLDRAKLGAYVCHSEPNSTLTWYTASLGAKSVTLELGFAKSFGQNDLDAFADTDAALVALLSNQLSPSSEHTPRFVVADTLIKGDDDLVFAIDKNQPNFSPISAGTVIAHQGGEAFSLDYDAYALFLNEAVASGLRAGLFLRRVS